MVPSKFQKKVWYNALTAFCIVVIGSLVVGSIWLSGEVLAYLQPVLVPLAVAGILAYLIEPIVSWLERRKLSRIKAILVVFVVSALAIVTFSWMIAKPLSSQVTKLNENKGEYLKKGQKMFRDIGEMEGVVSVLPGPIQDFIKKAQGKEDATIESAKEGEGVTIQPSVENVDLAPESDEFTLGEGVSEIEVPNIKELLHKQYEENGFSLPAKAVIVEDAEAKPTGVGSYFSTNSFLEMVGNSAPDLTRKVVDAVTRGTSKFFGVLGYALGFILVPIYLFFFLKESSVIQQNWQRFIPLRASKFKDEVGDVLGEINSYLIAFFRGQVLVSVIDGVLVGLVLMFFGHPFAVLIGIALAVLGVIPFLGNIICLVPAAVTAYAHYSITENQYWIGDNPWMYVVMVVAIFVIVQQINSLVTAPKIVGDSVGLHPMTVIFSMLFWSLLLGGFLGALLAVPLTASVKVLFSRYIWQKRVMADGAAA